MMTLAAATPNYRAALIALNPEDLNAEVRRASSRFNAAKRGVKAGRVAPADLDRARADFYIARGVKEQLDRWGAI